MRPAATTFVGLLLLFAVAGQMQGDSEKKPADRTALLIDQLSHPRFSVREDASRELIALGESALPALRRLTDKGADLDLRNRALQLSRKIMQAAGTSKSTGLEAMLIVEGSFQMGSARTETGRRAEETQHRVRITRPFLMGKYEVTQEEYATVMKVNPSWFAPGGKGSPKVVGKDTKRFPVEQVSWFDAVDFCNKLSKLDGYKPYYTLTEEKREGDTLKSANVAIAGGNGYRLPTEAEWEYACRAASVTAYHFGHNNSGKEANLKPGPAIGYGGAPNWPVLDRTEKVGTYTPNHWGLYDMHGNAGEWCQDWYDQNYYNVSPTDDPVGPETGIHRVMRSGSWLVNERVCRSAHRYWHTPTHWNWVTGFRIARTP